MSKSDARSGCALICALALTAITMWAQQAVAYPSYDDGTGNGCVQCHPGFSGGGSLHTRHLDDFSISSCTLCHQDFGGGKPVLTYFSGDGYGCAGCHGNDYGETSPNSGQPKATGYGLREHHAGEGVAGCPGCHVAGSLGHADPLPPILPENVAPPYYGLSTNNLTDPCSSTQEDSAFDLDAIGLDNDGNGTADAADPACAAGDTPTPPLTTPTPTPTLPGGGKWLQTVHPGESIQAAVDAAAPGGTIWVMPGIYEETHGGLNAVTVTKDGIRLIGRRKKDQKVILQAHPGQKNGIVIRGSGPGSLLNGSLVKGFTVQGFPNNGIVTQYVDNFRIIKNESIDNLENGIWPTLSANGLVKKNVAYGSLDSALWVEASENVRVLKNELHHSPTGLEITVSKNVVAKKNDIHDNTVGIGLYHPNAASLPPIGGDGDWDIIGNDVHDNNEPNSAPPGTMSAALPPGTGILVLGVDRINVTKNNIQNNGFVGIGVVDWCIGAALAGPDSGLDCVSYPPIVEPAPDDVRVIKNVAPTNGGAPPPGFEFLAADMVLLGGAGTNNCFSDNTTTLTIPASLPECL